MPRLSVRLSLDKTQMTVAERLVMTLSITTDAATDLTLPEIGKTLGDFTVASSEHTSTIADGPSRTTELRLVLEPFLGGEKTIPPLRVSAGSGSKTTTVTTDSVKIPVRTVLKVENEQPPALSPSKPPVEIAEPSVRPRLALLGAGVAGVAAYASAFGWALATSRRRRRQRDPVASLRTAIAFARSRLGPTSAPKDVASTVTEFSIELRQYLDTHLGIRAIGSSGPELIDNIRSAQSLSPDARSRLERLFGELDFARFAPEGLSLHRAASLLDDTAAVLEQTSGATAATGAPHTPVEVAA